MKHLIIIPALFICNLTFSQSDTLYLKNKEKIPVKVTEVSEYEIKYKRTDLDDSPSYITRVENIFMIKYTNGTSQTFIPDELTVPSDVKEIVKQKEAFKFHVFDLPTGKIAFGYERVLRTGINADFKVGLFNSNLFDAFNSNYERSMFNPYRARFGGGTFVKGGVKFLIGVNSQTRGKKYAHLLNGAYIRFDAFLSYLEYQGIKYSVPNPVLTAGYNNYWIEKTTDARNYNIGFLICLGAQHVLANILTLDYYVGLGFNGSSYTFSESDFGKNGPIYNQNYNQYYYGYSSYYRPETANVLAAQRFSNFMAATVGFNIGFVYKRKNAAR